jgi:hypothetical protein
MQEYATVFEITQKGFDWWFPAFGLIFVFFGPAIIRRYKASYKWAYAIVIFASLWSLLSFSSMYSNYQHFRRAYQAGQYLVAEGAVEDFHPMPYGGHQDECFSVQRVRFCYSDYGPTPGFNNTSSHGGPIRAELPIRVSYVGNTILKLEIRSESVPSQAEIRKRRVDATGLGMMLFLAFPAIVIAIHAAIWLYEKLRASTM